MPSAIFSVATDDQTLATIDANATKAGLSRSAYILQWIPEAHQQLKQTKTKRDTKPEDARRSGSGNPRPRTRV